MCLVLPAGVYGARAWDLTRSFWNNVIWSQAQVSFMQTLQTGANQSLDTVLLRYLSHDAEFHGLHPNFPHLQLGRGLVLQYASLARLLVFFVSVGSVWIWRHRRVAMNAHDAMLVAALWCSTLYVMLPETKARYAIYTFIAFLPWIEIAAARHDQGTLIERIALQASIVLCLVLVMVVVPGRVEPYGIGVVGSLGLWLGNVGLMAWAGSRAAVRGDTPAPQVTIALSPASRSR
jgi:hypothetical protein